MSNRFSCYKNIKLYQQFNLNAPSSTGQLLIMVCSIDAKRMDPRSLSNLSPKQCILARERMIVDLSLLKDV